MTDNQIPSVDFADLGTLGGTFRAILKKWLQATDGMLPATVIAVSDDRNWVTVEPNILVLGTDGSTTVRGQIAKVPVFTMGAGNFVLSWPIKPGDLGWIQANDRDISLYVQANQQAQPNTDRLHSFSDAVFYPDKARQWTLADEDADRAVWQSLDGTVKVAMGTDKIKITHPTLVEIDCPLVHVIGGDVRADSISLKTHTHSGVTTGSGNTGPPV